MYHFIRRDGKLYVESADALNINIVFSIFYNISSSSLCLTEKIYSTVEKNIPPKNTVLSQTDLKKNNNNLLMHEVASLILSQPSPNLPKLKQLSSYILSKNNKATSCNCLENY